MNIKKMLTIFTLPIMWLIYIIFELISGRLNDIATLIFNIGIIVIFALVGLVIYLIGIRFESGVPNKLIPTFFVGITLIDQVVKILIKFFYFDRHFYLIPNLLSFHPIINTNGSWLNARFNTNVSFAFLIGVNIAALLIFLELYRYYIFNGYKDFWSDMCFIFIFSGSFCSLIDKVFYGGSLDFIGISNLFIADIKDIYINIGILFLVLTIFNNDSLNTETETTFKEDLESLKKFLFFIKRDITKK